MPNTNLYSMKLLSIVIFASLYSTALAFPSTPTRDPRLPNEHWKLLEDLSTYNGLGQHVVAVSSGINGVESNIGVGTIICGAEENKRLLLTAAHVVTPTLEHDHPLMIGTNLYNPPIVERPASEVHIAYHQDDIILLQLNDVSWPCADLDTVGPFLTNKTAIVLTLFVPPNSTQRPIWMHQTGVKINSADLRNIGKRLIATNANIIPGISGSPVVECESREKCKIIAVVSAKLSSCKNNFCAGVTYFSPSQLQTFSSSQKPR